MNVLAALAGIGADTGVEIQFFPNDFGGGGGPTLTKDNAPVNNANDMAQTNSTNDNVEVGS